MPNLFLHNWLRIGAALLLVFLFGNGFVSAQSCSIQSDDPSPVCQGTVVTYTLTGLPPLATQIVWLTPGGTQMASGNSVSVHWDFALSTTVTANLFDNTGAPLGSCTLTPIVVQEQPAPMIVPDIAPGCGGHKSAEGNYGSPSYCEHTTLHFNANGDGGTYTWGVSGNATLTPPGTGTPIEVVTGADGFFTVTLTETSSAGCVGSVEEVYEVVEPPVVSFTELTHLSQNPITVCRGESLYFLGTAVDPNDLFIFDRIWQVHTSAGTLVASGAGLNYTYVFNDPGTYTVTYLVTNCAGCVGMYSVQVIVTQETVPTIICPSVVCEDGPPVEYCTDADCTGFNWVVGNGGNIVSGQGTSCILVSWTSVPASGFGSVTLNTSGCGPGVCAAPASIEVPILNTGAEITGPASTCNPNTTLTYSLPNWPGATYQWSITNVNGSGTVTPSGASNLYYYGVTLNNFTGSFNVHVVVSHILAECTFEYDRIVRAGDYMITGEKVYCRGEDVELGLEPDLPQGATAIWHIINPSWFSAPVAAPGDVIIPASAFPNSGTFLINVSITLANGDVLQCTHTNVSILREVDPVTEILGPTNICLNQPYTYTAIPDAGLGGSITWDPVGGTVDPVTGNPTSVTWTAGAPPYSLTATRSEFVPTYPGSSVGKVCVSEPFTRSDFERIPVPTALKIYAFTKACADHTNTYTASYDGGTDYFWSIDPALGSIVSGQGTPSIVVYWNVPLGTNNQTTMYLTAIVCGQALSTSFTLTVIEGPTPVISGPAVVCEGSPATFIATISGYSATATYTWELENNGVVIPFPSNNSATLNIPANLLHPGAWVVRVTAATSAGCVGSGGDAFDFTVVENPKPGIFTPDVPLCFHGQPAPCTINLYTQNYSGANATFSWSYNNAIVGSSNPYAANINPSGNPTGYGTYTVTVTNTYTEYPGLVCRASDSYTIYQPNCGPTQYVPPVYFTNWALPSCGVVEVWGSVPSVPNNKWNQLVIDARWRVEDFAGTVTPNPKPITSPAGLHTTLSVFSQPGFYPVWLEVWLKNPATGLPYPGYSTSRQVVEIPVAPDFNWDAACGSTPGTYEVSFTDLSEVIPPKPPQPGTTISSWSWTVDGMLKSTSQDYTHVFTPGTTAQMHEICLTVTSATAVYQPGLPYTCTICKTITIPAQPNVSITPITANVCEGTPIQFQAYYDPATILDLVWDFQDGTGSGIDNPVKTYNFITGGSNNYNVTATFTDEYGCTIVRTSAIHVNENNLTGEIVETSGDCNSMAVLTFQGTPPVESYLWSPGGATTPSLLVEENGIYSLTVTDAETGCTYSPPSEEVLVQSPFPAGILGAQHICRGEGITASVVSVPGYTFSWNSSTGQGGTGLNFTVFAGNIPANTNSVTITVTAFQGTHICAVESIVVNINPSPAAPILSYTFGCPPYPITVSAFDGTNPSQPINVSWGTGGIGALGYGPQITRFTSGFINATIVNEFGCSATASANLTPLPYISMLTGCYDVCDTVFQNGGGPVLPAPIIGGGQILDWQWFHNGMPIGSPAPPAVQPLQLTEALEGEIFLRIHKRFQNSDGTNTICEFDSDFFCLEVDSCSTDTAECRPLGPNVRTIICLEESDGFTSYYVHWDYEIDGESQPCMYAQNLPIKNANGDVIGHFTAVDHELTGNAWWHMEGTFVINAPYGPFDACWDIPFCLISTGELCSITTVCTDTGDPEANADILYGCDGNPCPSNFEWKMGVVCDDNPTTPATHQINLIVSYEGIPPGPPGCSTYDVLVNTTTGTTVPPNQLIEIENVTADGSGNLLLTPANYPQLSFDWYDEVGTDIVCLQVVIRYDDACWMPPGYPQDGRICTQRFCYDASDLNCSPEREGTGPYTFKSECRGFDGRGYLYTFEITLTNETTIAGYGLIPGQSSGNATLISCTGNVIQGVYYSPTPNPIFREGIVIRRPDGSTANYIIEGIMPYCGEGDGNGDGKEGGPRNRMSEVKAVQMTVVPNPATDQVQVQFQLPADLIPDQNAVVIHNSLGAEVLRQQLDEATSGGVTLRLNDLPGGWYQVSLWNQTIRIATQQLILIKP